MTNITTSTETTTRTSNKTAHALAERLEQGARALIAFASGLTDDEWQVQVLPDHRTVGVIVHHVASVYPVEIQLAQTLAEGKPVTGVTADDINAMTASHSEEHAGATK